MFGLMVRAWEIQAQGALLRSQATLLYATEIRQQL